MHFMINLPDVSLLAVFVADTADLSLMQSIRMTPTALRNATSVSTNNTSHSTHNPTGSITLRRGADRNSHLLSPSEESRHRVVQLGS